MAKKKEEIEDIEIDDVVEDEEVVEELEDEEVVEDLEVEDSDESEELEDFEEDDEDFDPSPKKKAPKGKKKKTAIIVSAIAGVVVVAVVVVLLWAFGVFGGKGSPLSAGTDLIKLDMTNISSFNSTTGTYDDVVGTTVKNRDELVAAIKAKEDVILKADIKLKQGDILEVSSSIYGAGYEIDATDVIKNNGKKTNWDQAPLTLVGTDDVIRIQDLRVTCKKVEVDAPLSLDINLSYHGYPIKVAPEVEAEIVHCILENGHRGIYIQAGAKVLVEGCIIRNCVDACISLETESTGPSEVTLKNNVLSNACVAGVLIWGYSKNVREDNYNTLNIEGFLDIYNWKTSDDAKLMPETESAASLGNKVIAGQISDQKNEKYTYIDSKGKKYFHSGIIIIATGDQKGNKPEVNGFNRVGFTKADFPLSGLAASIVKEFTLINYQGKNPQIKPGDKMDKSKIYDELVNGRK